MPNQDNRLDTSGLSYLWSKLKAVFSNKADKADTVLDTTLSRGRKANTTVGACSFAFGDYIAATGNCAHAEGYNTTASNQYSHAEGYNSTASGSAAHAEGYGSSASGSYSHAEGRSTKTSGNISHAEGYNAQATGLYSHAEGYSTSNSSTSYGARGKADHAEGYNTLANSGTSSSYYAAHAEGYETKATGNASHAEGRGSTASGTYSHSEGYLTTASNLTSHAEGYNSTASNQYSHAEGYHTVSAGSGSHAEGYYAQATGFASHAEGYNTKAGTGGYNVGVHVFGRFNTGFDKRVVTITDDMAVEWDPHKIHWAYSCIIRYTNDGTTTYYSPHADVPAYNDPSWDINSAFWHSYTLPSGTDPGTIPEWDKDSLYPANTVVKKTFANNVYYFQNHNEVTTTYIPLTSTPFYHVVQLNTTTEIWPFILEEVGNGIMSSAGSRSNARTLDLSGNEYLMGDVYVGCNPDSSGGSKLARASELPDVSGKADKDTNAVAGNFAQFDANGNPVDSGHKHSDYLTSHQDISGKADKVSNATNGNFASLDANGNLVDSGKKASDFMEGMTILSYGSSTWADFLAAYTASKVVYCRASSNSNPATGSQTRLAFMAYVNNADNPTEVEFRYYRSVSSHTAAQQGDQVYVYKLTSSGTWTVTVREAMSKIAAGTNISLSYASGTITLSATDTTYSDMSGATSSAGGTHGLVPAPSAGDQDKVLKGDGTWGTISALPAAPSSDGTYLLQCTVTNGVAAYSWVSMPNANGVSF